MNMLHKRHVCKKQSNVTEFVWGAVGVGKTSELKRRYPYALYVDLNDPQVRGKLLLNSGFLYEDCPAKSVVILDEVDRLPQLLDQVAATIDGKGCVFLLPCSSAKRLRRVRPELLGDMAMHRVMCPLTYAETEGVDLERVFLSGLLPGNLGSRTPGKAVESYVLNYLSEQIGGDSSINDPNRFGEFMKVMAQGSGDLVNYAGLARVLGISVKAARTYLEHLEDTFLAVRLGAWSGVKRRRLIAADKVFLFDVGVMNHLAGGVPRCGTAGYARAFETFLFMELRAYQAYVNHAMEIRYWRTSSGYEVDFVLGDLDVGIEVWPAREIDERARKGLLALNSEQKVRRSIVVSMDPSIRKEGGIETLPWSVFLSKLWSGELGV